MQSHHGIRGRMGERERERWEKNREWKKGKVNTTNFVSGWQFKIKCFFCRIYFVVQQTANTPKYISSTTHCSRRKLRFRFAFSSCCIPMYNVRRLVRNDAPTNVKKKKKFVVAIYLIWSLDVALHVHCEDDSLIFGLRFLIKAITWHCVVVFDELSLLLQVRHITNASILWARVNVSNYSSKPFEWYCKLRSFRSKPSRQIRSKLQFLLTSQWPPVKTILNNFTMFYYLFHCLWLEWAQWREHVFFHANGNWFSFFFFFFPY